MDAAGKVGEEVDCDQYSTVDLTDPTVRLNDGGRVADAELRGTTSCAHRADVVSRGGGDEDGWLVRPAASSHWVEGRIGVDDAGPSENVSPSKKGADGEADDGEARSSVRVRWNPGRRGAIVILIVAVVAIVVAAVGFWRTQRAPAPVSVAVATHGSRSSSTDKPAELVVAVSGKVHRPGLVRVPEGSRVADAVDKAGGMLPDTDFGSLNLARKLRDGELVVVGAPQGGPAGQPGETSTSGGLIDLNTASVAELDGLDGVGPVLAQRIVDYRTEHGGFRSVADLRQVDGIGETRFARLQDLVTA